jgi:hypothetical protein
LGKNRPYPKVVPSVNIPLDQITIALRCKRIEAVTLADLAPLLVRLLFMLLVVPMVRIDQVFELPDLMLRVCQVGFDIMKVSVVELFAEMRKRMLDLVFQGAMPLGAVSLHAELVLRRKAKTPKDSCRGKNK